MNDLSERKDYAVLISLATREEAEVAASALRAEGVDAFIGNSETANMHWGLTQAMGGLQIMVPAAQINRAKMLLQNRIEESATGDEDEPYDPGRRRDRWKAWILFVLVGGPLLVIGVIFLLGAALGKAFDGLHIIWEYVANLFG